jgi:hypothetical protein
MGDIVDRAGYAPMKEEDISQYREKAGGVRGIEQGIIVFWLPDLNRKQIKGLLFLLVYLPD